MFTPSRHLKTAHVRTYNLKKSSIDAYYRICFVNPLYRAYLACSTTFFFHEGVYTYGANHASANSKTAVLNLDCPTKLLDTKVVSAALKLASKFSSSACAALPSPRLHAASSRVALLTDATNGIATCYGLCSSPSKRALSLCTTHPPAGAATSALWVRGRQHGVSWRRDVDAESHRSCFGGSPPDACDCDGNGLRQRSCRIPRRGDHGASTPHGGSAGTQDAFDFKEGRRQRQRSSGGGPVGSTAEVQVEPQRSAVSAHCVACAEFCHHHRS